MPLVLHLVKSAPDALALETIRRQLQAGDQVTVALLDAAGTGALPPGVTARRVPAELTWDELLELIFASDRVIAW